MTVEELDLYGEPLAAEQLLDVQRHVGQPLQELCPVLRCDEFAVDVPQHSLDVVRRSVGRRSGLLAGRRCGGRWRLRRYGRRSRMPADLHGRRKATNGKCAACHGNGCQGTNRRQLAADRRRSTVQRCVCAACGVEVLRKVLRHAITADAVTTKDRTEEELRVGWRLEFRSPMARSGR
jgi:hypothetical protein